MSRRTKIGLCTDSNAQVPRELAERFEIEVVPMTITVDEHDYLEGVDLDVDRFYEMFTVDRQPVVSTAQPSPGQFALAYEELTARGCTEILSVHVSSAVSGTLNAARLGARGFDVPVRLVDSGTASFGVGCCTWAAAEAICAGASLDEAAAVAESLAPSIGNVFIVGALDLVGGSEHPVAPPTEPSGVPVLALRDGQIQVIERVAAMRDAVAVMAAAAAGWGERLKVAIGVADLEARPLADALQCQIAAHPSVDEVIRYRIAPSVAAHTGPGTLGCFMFPASLALSTRAAS
jgi:fatty acid-binding protein DegV